MRSLLSGHRMRRHRGDGDSTGPRVQKPQVERFNRFLFFLFPDSHSAEPISTAPALPQPLPRPTLSSSRPPTAPSTSEMPHSASNSATNADLPLDIVLHDNPIVLRGTGVDIEPGFVRGAVRLSLPEATDIKVIDIRCTGKSRVNVLLKEGTRSQTQTTLYYIKDIGLLEGDKSHPHTLKAGRHEFPFTFEIDSKAAASLTANFGMAVIDWKLRATAVRPSFSTNFTATKDLTVVRSFGTEALEFQQTLEIENVWPEKINYVVILPHKAWAAGDHISAILKFTPLVKGVKVVSVKMSLQEKVKTVWKTLPYEDIRVVCSKKEALRRSRRRSSTGADATAMLQQQQSRLPAATSPSFFRRVGSRVQSRENLLGLFRTRTGEEGTPSEPPTPPEPSPGSSSPERTSSEDGSEDADDVEMVIKLHVPTDATPSHAIAPVIVSHRVKWDVLISNLDGHYSELRCSLPVHILAKEVLEETLAATNATRTALLGEGHGVQVQEIVLPAYLDHLKDRVAIAELHDHALATNPLNSASIPTSPEEDLPEVPNGLSSSYNPSSVLAEQPGRSNVPRVASMPDASERGRLRRTLGFNAPADAHSSELYLSLGRRPDTGNSVTTPPEAGSHPASQSSSRASSPDRSGEPSTSSGGRSSRHGFMRPFTVFSKSSTKTPSTPPSSHPNSRPGSSHKNPSAWHRQTFSRTSSGPSAPSSPDHNISPLPSQPTSRSSTSPPRAPSSSALGEYYDAVPEYAFAARGFLGGGITPLSSFRGLPSYDQAQRSRASSPQSSSVGMTSFASTASAASRGSSTSSGSGGSRRRGSRKASMAGDQRPPVPSLPPLPPSPTPSI